MCHIRSTSGNFFSRTEMRTPPEQYTPSFGEIAGKVFVSPVVRTFIYERTKEETRAWVDDVARWKSLPLPSTLCEALGQLGQDEPASG